MSATQIILELLIVVLLSVKNMLFHEWLLSCNVAWNVYQLTGQKVTEKFLSECQPASQYTFVMLASKQPLYIQSIFHLLAARVRGQRIRNITGKIICSPQINPATNSAHSSISQCICCPSRFTCMQIKTITGNNN